MRTLALLAAAGPGLVFGANGGVVLHGSIRAGGSVRAVDAATRNETGIAYLTNRRPTGVASWLTVAKPSGGLAAVTIRVPRSAAPGQYFAGLLVEGTARHVVGVEVDVAGPQVARFVVGAVHVGRRALYLHVTNTGNVARSPEGAVSIADDAGAKVAQLTFRMASFLPHTSVDYPLPPGSRLVPGTYTASVRMTYAGVTSSAAPQFVVPQRPTFTPRPPGPPATLVAARRGGSPWSRLAAAAATVVLGAAAAVLLWRRRPVTVTATPLAPELAPARCEGLHYWDVDWQRPQAGANGAVVYPHRCRRCGVEVLAVDIADAGRNCT